MEYEPQEVFMYKEHPVFNPPPSDAILWRYMDFTKYVSILEKQALFFARSDKLGDPFEGSYSKVNEVLRPIWYKDKLPKETLQNFSVYQKHNRRTKLINCWHQSNHESEAMWRLYSRENDGIAIMTEFNYLKDSFICEKDIYIGKVVYVDYTRQVIPERNDNSRYLHKRKSFEHENEVRAISSIYQKDGEVYNNLYNDNIIGVYYQVDLSILIQKVIVSPFAPDWFLDLVRSVTSRYIFHFKVDRSTQAEDPTW